MMAPPADVDQGENMITVTKLVSEFASFGVNLDDLTTIDKLQAMCNLYKLDEATMVDEWMGYTCTSGIDIEVTNTTLEQFEKELQERKLTLNCSLHKPVAEDVIYNKDSIAPLLDDGHELIDAYCTPEMKASKRFTTPDSNLSRKSFKTAYNRTPASRIFSPSIYSPDLSTPSSKYSSRQNAKEILTTFSSDGLSENNMNWKGSGLDVIVAAADPETHLDKRYKYMFQKVGDRVSALHDQLEKMVQTLQSEHGIDEVANVSVPSQEIVTVIGRIGCDSIGRLNAASVVLEGYTKYQSCSCATRLNLNEINQFSVFPGQIVALDGINSSGNVFLAKKLYEGVRLPFSTALSKEDQSDSPLKSTPLVMLIACGPFTTSDNLQYQPLFDLLTILLDQSPDVAILFGPFVDAKHQQIEKCEINTNFEELFIEHLRNIAEGSDRAKTSIIIVPSTRDVHHDYIYPQPPFSKPSNLKNAQVIHFMPDPCTITVNDITIGLTSTDILFHMGGEEASVSPGITDRIVRLLTHLMEQKNYYPLYPPSEEVNVDQEKFIDHGYMPVTPDILITPSDLRYFIKDVGKCLCVNPGRLAKGQIGGTYARVTILPSNKSNHRVVDRAVAQIVRI